jgi:hypothetical protein
MQTSKRLSSLHIAQRHALSNREIIQNNIERQSTKELILNISMNKL